MIITLYHGTSFQSATKLVHHGWKPNSSHMGSQMGNPRFFYLTNFIENAEWYAQEKDNPTILEIKINITKLSLDPEDRIGETVEDELSISKRTGFPANLATRYPISPQQINIVK